MPSHTIQERQRNLVQKRVPQKPAGTGQGIEPAQPQGGLLGGIGNPLNLLAGTLDQILGVPKAPIAEGAEAPDALEQLGDSLLSLVDPRSDYNLLDLGQDLINPATGEIDAAGLFPGVREQRRTARGTRALAAQKTQLEMDKLRRESSPEALARARAAEQQKITHDRLTIETQQRTAEEDFRNDLGGRSTTYLEAARKTDHTLTDAQRQAVAHTIELRKGQMAFLIQANPTIYSAASLSNLTGATLTNAVNAAAKPPTKPTELPINRLINAYDAAIQRGDPFAAAIIQRKIQKETTTASAPMVYVDKDGAVMTGDATHVMAGINRKIAGRAVEGRAGVVLAEGVVDALIGPPDSTGKGIIQSGTVGLPALLTGTYQDARETMFSLGIDPDELRRTSRARVVATGANMEKEITVKGLGTFRFSDAYNPDIPAVKSMMMQLAYLVASSSEPGGKLSEMDVLNALTRIGDPNKFLANPAQLRAKLATVRKSLARQKDQYNKVIGGAQTVGDDNTVFELRREMIEKTQAVGSLIHRARINPAGAGAGPERGDILQLLSGMTEDRRTELFRRLSPADMNFVERLTTGRGQ